MPLEIYFLLAGIVLFVIEMIVPGFGIFGVSSIICFTIGGYYIMGGGIAAISVLAVIYLAFVIIVSFLCLYLPKESKWNPFVLWDKQQNSKGYIGSQDLTMLLGKTGIAFTVLRPAGTVVIDGKRFDVSSLGDYIDKDTAVKIIKVEGSKIFVEKVKE